MDVHPHVWPRIDARDGFSHLKVQESCSQRGHPTTQHVTLIRCVATEAALFLILELLNHPAFDQYPTSANHEPQGDQSGSSKLDSGVDTTKPPPLATRSLQLCHLQLHRLVMTGHDWSMVINQLTERNQFAGQVNKQLATTSTSETAQPTE